MADEHFEENASGLTINMDDVPDSSFPLVPKGTYACVIESCDFQFSKSSGKPMWNIVLSIAEGEFVGQKLFTFMSFSEKALPMTKQHIAAIKPEILSKAFDPKRIAEEAVLIGTACRVKTVVETYEGKDRPKVKTFLAAVGDSFLNG